MRGRSPSRLQADEGQRQWARITAGAGTGEGAQGRGRGREAESGSAGVVTAAMGAGLRRLQTLLEGVSNKPARSHTAAGKLLGKLSGSCCTLSCCTQSCSSRTVAASVGAQAKHGDSGRG